MDILIHPTYFPNIAHFVGMVNADNVVFEMHDNYQKQTFRNRTSIFAANGKLTLNIPVNYTQNNRQLYKDVRIANDGKWQSIHWKSLQSAYKTSPYFEYYEDDIRPLFHKPYTYILDYNFECIDVILRCIQFELNQNHSASFKKEISDHLDLRHLVNVKSESKFTFPSYIQVFTNKFGYLNNLSILDLLANEGPNALSYLESQKLDSFF